jgi:hypothetical protein
MRCRRRLRRTLSGRSWRQHNDDDRHHHTVSPASLQESYGRGLVRYLAEREWAEELPSADELGLTDDGWRQYVELVIDP